MAAQRLSPRQKMINMMYLVLTALLALNVSKETLDVIDRANQGLNETTENFHSKNEMIYAAFDKANTIYPIKVGPYKEKADSLKNYANQLIDLIDDFKLLIVQEADGQEARLDSIESKEDLNVPAQIMLVEKSGKRADSLKNMFHNYRDFLLNILGDQDPTLSANISNALTKRDIPRTPEEPGRSWAQENFENYPLIGVIMLMSQMQAEVRNTESDVLNYLYQAIDEESFKFNKLEAVVIPKSTYIFQGDNFEADVLLVAKDTTQDPVISIGNRQISVEDGVGKYVVKTSKLGMNPWSGIIEYKAPDGSVNQYPFSGEYRVAPPSVIVAPTKMNILYKGLANPLEIGVPGVPANRIRATMTRGELKKANDGTYDAYPSFDNGTSVITVQAQNGEGQWVNMGTKNYRLKRVPDPEALIGGKKSGTIRKEDLVIQSGIQANLKDFEFEFKYTVIGFNLLVPTQGGFMQDAESNSAYFTDEQKQLLNSVKSGQQVIFNNIVARGDDNTERELNTIVFKIR